MFPDKPELTVRFGLEGLMAIYSGHSVSIYRLMFGGCVIGKIFNKMLLDVENSSINDPWRSCLC